VPGVGNGGTVPGFVEVLRARQPDLQSFAVEPASSPILSGGEAGYHNIQGIGAGFVPEVLNTAVYDEVLPVTDEEATLYTRRLAREEGILVGVSSGAVCAAALQVARRLGKGKTVLAIFCDTGER